MYYLVTTAQYDLIADQLTETTVWDLKNLRCIVQTDNPSLVTDYVMYFDTHFEVNDWRWNPDTEEWREWITQEEYDGIV